VLTTSGVPRLRRTRAASSPGLVARWGEPLARKYDRAVTLYLFGWLGGISMMITYILASSLGAQVVGIAALVVCFAVTIPGIAVAAVRMSSFSKKLCARYGISPHTKPPLSFKALKTPGTFDAWLAAHDRQAPRSRPFGGPV
jgi:hypothetical protein